MSGRYIEANALYEKTAEWEAQALHMVEIHIHDEDKTEWKKWSAILQERSAFKFDIADAPTADVRENVHGFWCEVIDIGFHGFRCNLCGEDTYKRSNFCSNCGADMR